MKEYRLYFEYIVVAILFVLTNAISLYFGYLSLVLLLVLIFTSTGKEPIYWIMFMLPNIRILDVVGFTYGINILLIAASLKYIFLQDKYGNKYFIKTKFNRLFVLTAFLLFAYEFSHVFLNLNSFGKSLFDSFNIAFDYFVMLIILERGMTLHQFKESTYSLIIGIIVSILTFLVANPSTLVMIRESAYRLGAYGTDPNYLSVYIVISMSALAMLSFYKSSNLIDIVFILILVLFGLLTVSKMCVICMLLLVVLYLIIAVKNSNNKRIQSVFIRFSPVVIIGIYFLKDSISLLWNKFLNRFSGNIDISSFDQYSSGRSEIISFYLQHYFDSFTSCVFGRGINYFSYYKNYGAVFVSHNTYLDFFLSWGILGCILFMVMSIFVLKKHVSFKSDFVLYIPLIMMMIMIFSLSCMSSDMFWFLMAFVLIPLVDNKLDSRIGFESA